MRDTRALTDLSGRDKNNNKLILITVLMGDFLLKRVP